MLEEIVGEINDEYDEETRAQIRKNREAYVFDGMLAVHANQQLGFDLPEDGGYTTIAGFLGESRLVVGAGELHRE